MRLIDADELRTVKSIQSADFNSIENIQKWIDNAETYNQVGHRMATAEGFITNPEYNKSDLISRDALKKKLNFVYSCAYIESKSKEGIASDIIDEIDNAPTVDAISTELHEKVLKTVGEVLKCQSNLRPKGKWIENLKTFYWECSECGNSALYNKIGVTVESQFCPNCGADMRGEEQ